MLGGPLLSGARISRGGPGDLGRLSGGGVRLRIFGLVDLEGLAMGGSGCARRSGEREVGPSDGLRGGRRIEL